MAAVLEKAGIIEELFDVIYKWLGALKGGLASATVLACTVLAAMVGVVGATEVTMGMIALPAMLKRGYEPKLACGALLVVSTDTSGVVSCNGALTSGEVCHSAASSLCR